MAKTWKQIVMESGTVHPSQTKKDKQEMLKEKGMTWEEFTETDEWMEMAMQGMHSRFDNPGIPLYTEK